MMVQALLLVFLAQHPDLLLAGGSVVDGSGSTALEDAWVHVRDGRIHAMGQGSAPDVEGARRIDLQGRTLVPGLADMHVHLGGLSQARWMMKLFLAYGITTVFDTGNSLGNLAAIRRWMDEQDVVPHLYVSGYILQGDYEEQRFLQPGSAVDARLEDELAFGVDFVKTYNWTSSSALKQIAEIAKRNGVGVTGHTPLSWTSIGSIDAGIEILQHLRLRPYELLDDFELIAKYPVDGAYMRRTGFWSHFDPESDAVQKTLDAWDKRKERFFLTPTLVVQEAVAESYDYPDAKLTDHPDVRLVSPALLESWEGESPPLHWGELEPAEIAEAKGSVEGMATFVKLAHRRGIRILSGTDTPLPWLVPGASLHRELMFFTEKGRMTPVETIHTSTGRAAEALRVPDRGTIREGNVADLVVVRGELADDIRTLENIEIVVLGGRVYDREELLDEAAALARDDLPE